MNIVLDATGVQSGSGGMTTFLTGLLDGWPRVAADDEMIVLGMPELPDAIQPGSSVVRAVKRVDQSGQFARIRAQQLLLPRLLKRFAPDVLFSADPSIPLRQTGFPTVATVHDLRHLARPDEFGRARRTYREFAWSRGIARADRLVVNSDATAAQVSEYYPAAAGRVRFVRFGADHVDSWRPAAAVDGPRAITFGHWSNKRPDFAIRVWGALYRTNPELEIALDVVGVPEADHGPLRQIAVDEGVARQVRIHSFVPDEEYRGLFAGASVVLMTATLEGFGLPVVEAMQLGIPVVASRGVGMETAGGDAALYADPDSPDSFAAQVARVMGDDDERARIASAGRIHAGQFNWADTAASVRAVLAEAIDAHRA